MSVSSNPSLTSLEPGSTGRRVRGTEAAGRGTEAGEGTTWAACRRVLWAGRKQAAKHRKHSTASSRRPFVSHTGRSLRATRMPAGAVVALGDLASRDAVAGRKGLVRVVKRKRNCSRAPQERQETTTPRLFPPQVPGGERGAQPSPPRSQPRASPRDVRRAKRTTHRGGTHIGQHSRLAARRKEEGGTKKASLFLGRLGSARVENLGLDCSPPDRQSDRPSS